VAPPSSLYSDDVPVASAGTVLAIAVGAMFALDGGLLWWIGPGALLPAGRIYSLLPTIFFVVGAALIVGPLTLDYPRVVARVRRAAPRLYPLAPTWLHLLIYLGISVGSVAVYLGLFDIFSGAHANGDTMYLPNPNAANLLLAIGSLLVWSLAMYCVFVVLRAIRMGRMIAAQKGVSPYGLIDPEHPPQPVKLLKGAHVSPPRVVGDRRLQLAVMVVWMGGFSVAIQVIEYNTLPATPLQWAWGQFFLPLWAVLIASGLYQIDGGIRSLEREYVSAIAQPDSPAARGFLTPS
jgi:hypothetical protein